MSDTAKAFPEGFRWGTATAAHQIEGGNWNNDWWAWEHNPDSGTTEPSGDACDSYHRYAEDHAMLLELEDGECRRADLVDPATVDAPFVIAGPYAVWKEVVRGKLDPIAAIMRRQMRLKGSIATLVQHLATAKALVGCATLTPTRFPDEE